MSTQNAVSIVGNVTRDPELRFLANGSAVTNFGVAVNERWKDRQDQWQEKVSFFDVTCWRDLADNVSESVSKGDRVLIMGKLELQTWETPEGDKRSKIHIVADEVGAAMRWATVQITKTEKRGPGGGQQVGPGEQPPDNIYDNEEPF